MNRRAAPDTLAWWLFIAGLTLSFVLPGYALEPMGIHYDAPQGSALAKLHPGSYLLVLAWLCALVRHGNPLEVALQSARRQPAVTVYLACMILVFFWIVLRQGSAGTGYIVQTLWIPGLALLTLQLLSQRRRRQVLKWLMVLLCANSALALAEYFGKFHLVPLPPEAEGTFFRSSGLLGHPLANAIIGVALLPGLALMPWRPLLRAAAMVLVLCSLLAFGARTAVGVGVAVYGTQLLLTLGLRALRGRYSYLQLTGGSAALLLGGAALVGTVLASGLGARVFNNLRWDNSANVRLRVWDAFDFLRGSDWWLGLPPVEIDRIAAAIGLDPRYEAIENFWIYAFLQFGAIGFLPFVVGLAVLTGLMLVRGAPVLRPAVLVFFAVASTTNALSSKTCALTLLAVVALASTRPRSRKVAGAPRWQATRVADWAITRPMAHAEARVGLR